MRVLLLLLTFIFAACEVQPPGIGQRSGEANFQIRNILFECTNAVEDCKDLSADGEKAISFYTFDDCGDITDSSPTVATGSSPLSCDSNKCTTDINEFFRSDASVESLPQGSYTLVSFIDLNDNSFPDQNEPYFCTTEVKISAKKNNATVNVVLVRTRAEGIL